MGAFAALVALITVMVGVQPSPAGANHLPAVWVGSPIEGRWAAYASSLPASHGIYYGGDWSVDLPGAAGQVVTVFAAPQNGSTSVRARNACASRAGETAAQTRARGGERIEVGIYTATTKIGVRDLRACQPFGEHPVVADHPHVALAMDHEHRHSRQLHGQLVLGRAPTSTSSFT